MLCGGLDKSGACNCNFLRARLACSKEARTLWPVRNCRNLKFQEKRRRKKYRITDKNDEDRWNKISSLRLN